MSVVVRIEPKHRSPGRQRVFYLGRAYIGSQCNQDLIHLYIKRLPKAQWALQTYVAGQVSVLQVFASSDLHTVMTDYDFCEPISVDDLMACGWLPTADIYDFSTGDVLE
jgi:hypothetical protein